MAGKDSDFDKLMKAILLKSVLESKDMEIHPFTCEVSVTPTGISCGVSANKAFLEDVDGGMEWLDETSGRIKDIMCEQTTKLSKLLDNKYGFKFTKVEPDNANPLEDILRRIFGGGGRTITTNINTLPAMGFCGRQT